MTTPLPARFEEKVRAGWLGKVIGGTLGGPHEGKASKLALTFYDPVPDEAMPNDDLDLQVVWLRHLLEIGATSVRIEDLARAWQRHVGFPWCEYAVGLRNLEYGLSGAQLGAFDNWFGDCMGAAIRTELWAFAAGANPVRAAHFAWIDAQFDHAGDGIYSAIFFAVLEAAAFTQPNLDAVIEAGLAAIPAASRTAFAVRRTQFLWGQRRDWEAVRESLLVDLAPTHFTDTAINIAFTVLGLLAGAGDFERTILIANNCGWDTDCTAATAAAILGILDPACIPSKWSAPIGGRVLLNAQIREMSLETTLDALTEDTLRLQRQLTGHEVTSIVVAPRMRATEAESPIRIAYRVGTTDAPLESIPAPAFLDGEPFHAAGHWLRHSLKEPHARTAQFSFEVKLDRDGPVRFMAFTPRPCRIFVDGTLYGHFEPRSWAPGWHGPSFHLYAERAPDWSRPQRAAALELKAGGHRFDVLVDHDGTDAVELVVGAAEASTDLWLPFALALKR